MHNEPPGPKAVPAEQDDKSKVGHTQHGIPHEDTSEEPKGMPTSDRHQTETTPAKT